MSDDLQSYLDGCRAEGVLHSSGVFSLDLGKAREKLGLFFGPHAQNYLHYAVRAALACSPARLSLRESAQCLVLEFGGEAPAENELLALFGQTDMGLRALQMALVGALEQGCESMELESRGRLARFSRDGERFLAAERTDVNRLRFLRRSTPRRGLGWLRLPRSSWRSLLDKDFGWCLTPLEVEGRPWKPPRLAALGPLAANRQLPALPHPSLCWPSSTGPPMAVTVRPGKTQTARCVWLYQGATLSEREEGQLPPNLHLVVDIPLPLDLSLRQPGEGWEPPVPRLAPLAASLLCRAFLEQTSWLTPSALSAADWILQVLISRAQLAMAEALAGRLLSANLAASPWAGAAILQRLTYLLPSLPERPSWAGGLEERREVAWNLVVHRADSARSWKEYARCGWPCFPECPALARECADLKVEAACALLQTWVRDTSGSQDRTQVALLRLLLDDLTSDRAQSPASSVLTAREILFLGDGPFPERLGWAGSAPTLRSASYLAFPELVPEHDYRVECGFVTIRRLLDADPGPLTGYGHELAYRLCKYTLMYAAPSRSKVAPPTQSEFLAAHIEQAEAEARDWEEDRYLQLRFSLGQAEVLTGRREAARRTLTSLRQALRSTPPRRRVHVAQYYPELDALMEQLEMGPE